MNVTFKQVAHDHIRECFLTVLKEYPALHPYPITLEQKNLKGSTMQAQPIIRLSNLFSSQKRYRVRLAHFVRDSPDLPIHELDPAVLTGWFAHEMGHLVDFEGRSNLGMVGYGLRYLVSTKHQRQAEHEADYIALKAGFYDEIMATKEFLLNHVLIDDGYKAKLHKYYMSPQDVDVWMSSHAPHVQTALEL